MSEIIVRIISVVDPKAIQIVGAAGQTAQGLLNCEGETDKIIDDYTCQACSFRLEVSEGKFIIEVHHLNPLGELANASLTSIDDLVCLCPTCHRIAHTRPRSPLPLAEIRALRI